MKNTDENKNMQDLDESSKMPAPESDTAQDHEALHHSNAYNTKYRQDAAGWFVFSC